MGAMLDIIRTAYIKNKLPNGESFNGISDNAKVTSPDIKLYPNPAKDQVTIDVGQIIRETIRLQVYNSSGMILLTKDVNPQGSKIVLNTSSLLNGIYLVTVRSKSLITTMKLSVIR